MINLRSILVPVDFDDTSRTALHYAAEMAKLFGSRLHLLHVLPQRAQQYWVVEMGTMDVERTWTACRSDAELRLYVMASEQHLDPLGTTTLVSEGHAPDEIVAYATKQEVDLIVMGTHGYGALGHLVHGSVAERVVRQAGRPVLVVPRPAVPDLAFVGEVDKLRTPAYA
jgi:nucleotide-binding universal stress UspA family protein